jgi:hypothetical protein
MFSALLIAFLAAQLWFGSLLMFDSYQGKLERFQRDGQPGGERQKRRPRPRLRQAHPTSAPAPATIPTAGFESVQGLTEILATCHPERTREGSGTGVRGQIRRGVPLRMTSRW